MSCSCIFSEDDWDKVVIRCAECQFIFDNLDKIQKKSFEKKVELKNQLFHAILKLIIPRNYLRKFFFKITEKIHLNNELKVFVNEMSYIFDDVKD